MDCLPLEILVAEYIDGNVYYIRRNSFGEKGFVNLLVCELLSKKRFGCEIFLPGTFALQDGQSVKF